MLLVLPTCRVRFKGADHQAQTSTADFHRRVPGNFIVVAKRFLCAEHAENEIWKEDMACKIDDMACKIQRGTHRPYPRTSRFYCCQAEGPFQGAALPFQSCEVQSMVKWRISPSGTQRGTHRPYPRTSRFYCCQARWYCRSVCLLP